MGWAGFLVCPVAGPEGLTTVLLDGGAASIAETERPDKERRTSFPVGSAAPVATVG